MRKSLIAVLAATFFLVGFTPAQGVESMSAPVVQTELEVFLDASAAEYGTTWSDLSGNDNDLAMTAGASDAGNWFSFDGTGFGEFNELELVNPAAYTKILWFRTSDLTVRNNLFSAGSRANGHYLWGGGEEATADNCPASGDRLGAANEAVSTDYSRVLASDCTPINTWIKVAVVFDTTNGWKMYINGLLDATDPDIVTFSYPLPSNVNSQIGAFGGRNMLKGDIAQVYLYNRALSGSEIGQLFDSTRSSFGYVDFEVSFDAQGGGSSVDQTGVLNRDSITLPTTTRPLHILQGWYDSPSGGQKIGDPGDSYQPSASTETLYAQWALDADLVVHLDASQDDYTSVWSNLIAGGQDLDMVGATDQGDYFNFSGTNQYGKFDGFDLVEPEGYSKLVWFRLNNGTSVNNLFSGDGTDSHAFWANSGKAECPRTNLSAGNAPLFSGSWNQVQSPDCLDLGQWYLGVVTFDAAQGWVMHLNGEVNATSTSTTKMTTTRQRSNYVGSYNGDYFLNGDIAKVMLWNKVIDSSEVSAIFEQDRANFGYTDYTASFDAQGASATPAQVTGVAAIDSFTLPTVTRSVDRFEGWFDQATGGNRLGGAGDSYTPPPGTTGLDLFAQWTPGYEVSFDSQGGSVVQKLIHVQGDSDPALPEVNRANHTFEGWFDAPSEGTRIGGIGDSFTPTATTTLYAQWTAIPLTFTLSLDSGLGSVSPGSLSFTEGGEPLILPEATRADYVFTGWYDDEVAGVKIGDAGDSLVPTSSITLHARWVQASLAGLDPTDLNLAGTIVKIAGVGNTNSFTTPKGKVTITVPADALPDGTTVSIYSLSDNSYAQGVLTDSSDFLLSLVVAWKALDESVPVASEPITVKIENSEIHPGADVYAILNGVTQLLGTADTAGEVTVSFTTDPVITVTNNLAPALDPPPQQTVEVTNPAPIQEPEESTPESLEPELGEIQTDAPVESRIRAIGELEAKMYSYDLVGKGKVQIFVNGREIAWVRAESEADPKLRQVGDRSYLVRTVALKKDTKNILEIYLNGERIQRVAYAR